MMSQQNPRGTQVLCQREQMLPPQNSPRHFEAQAAILCLRLNIGGGNVVGKTIGFTELPHKSGIDTTLAAQLVIKMKNVELITKFHGKLYQQIKEYHRVEPTRYRHQQGADGSKPRLFHPASEVICYRVLHPLVLGQTSKKQKALTRTGKGFLRQLVAVQRFELRTLRI